jgi:multiple sugar transport system ATP-binding protein
MAGVELKNVSKRFGKVVALDSLSLEIADGEFMVLVGPSGCGKTTALRIIAGLEEATDGIIEIGSKDVSNVPAKDRDIAMVFQTYALYPHMNVRENMAFGLKLRMLKSWWWQVTHPSEARSRRAEISRRVADAAKLLGVEDLLERRPRELSGGQRQRVALGRAIVRDPKVFLMDEPLSNLDAKLRVQTRAELIRLHHRLRVTTIYVTHDQIEAMTMGDRIAVLKDGVLQQVDTPEQLYRKPANTFVASFIGSPPMNLVRVNAEEGMVVFGGAALSSPVSSGAVIMGMRPESLSSGDAGHEIKGEVDVIEPLGGTKLVMVKVGGDTITAALHSGARSQEGEPISLRIRPEDLFFFDASSGSAL